MNRFAVLEEDNPKIAIFHLRNLDPPTEAPILLNYFTYGIGAGAPNPGVRNHGAIWAAANGVKVGGRLHPEK